MTDMNSNIRLPSSDNDGRSVYCLNSSEYPT